MSPIVRPASGRADHAVYGRAVTDDEGATQVARQSESPARTTGGPSATLVGHRRRHHQAEHGEFLGDVDLVWCPEGLREADAGLLGPVKGRRVLEVGCGAASSARWLSTSREPRSCALDISGGMLRHATEAAPPLRRRGALVQADAKWRCRCATRRSTWRVHGVRRGPVRGRLGPGDARGLPGPAAGGRVGLLGHLTWMRWIFADDPGEEGLVAFNSYFDRRPYVEFDDSGRAVYVEHHRPRATGSGNSSRLVSPSRTSSSPNGRRTTRARWGQWSPATRAAVPRHRDLDVATKPV